MNNYKQLLVNRINKLDEWITKNQWKAYDPFDGLISPLLSSLTLGNHYLRIAVQQGIRRFPVNLRPLVGIKKETSSKGMGFCALAYLKMYQATNDTRYLDKMRFCLGWLIDNYSQGYSGYAWGNHFRYESRGQLPLLPGSIPTAFIYNSNYI